MIKRIFATLLLLCLCLTGCAQEEDTKVMGSEIWTEGLPLTWGQLEGEKLAVLPWDSGRCEATAKFRMAETRDGYYIAGECRLLYADKVDLCNWVPVCGKPDCAHKSMYTWMIGEIMCDAEIGGRVFYIKDGRIWTTLHLDNRHGLMHNGAALVSMSPTCTDRRLEVSDGEILKDMVTVTCSTECVRPWIWLYSLEDTKQDGSRVAYCFRYTDAGWEEYLQAPAESEYSGWDIGVSSPTYLFGDFAIANITATTESFVYMRFLESGYEQIKLPTSIGYLSGDVFRYFTAGDGYYDLNVKTREEVKLTDARLENSHAQIVLPNCIIESTLLSYDSLKTRIPGMEHNMEIFDGQQWHTVTLPNELQVNERLYLTIVSVTSDSIIFAARQEFGPFYPNAHTDMYRIDLTKGTWDLEFFVQIRDNIL